jgi:hypothetical protein
MYTDLYLKFTSESQANEYLYTQVPTEWDEDGEPIAWYSQPNFANIDVIGVITEGGEWDEDGNVITEPVALEGWHVNVRLVGEDGSALEPFMVEPEHPRRIWG